MTLYRSHHGGSWQSSPLQPAASLDLLGTLEGYEITEVLGQGGMGQVFKAYEHALKRWVAIKVMAPYLAGEEVARRRFAREAQAAAAVRHENVITIHAVREANGLPFFVMEYVAGGSLQDYLDRQTPPDWSTVARLGAEVASGLAAAHAKGLIHRDIKPSNILLRTDESAAEPGLAKISDFGLARIADESRLTQTGLIAGTPMYMAPEQVLGEALDHRADLFSLGSVLYTLCTGREPFVGDGAMAVIRQVCEVTPPPVAEVNPAIPPWLAAVIERLHAKRPEDRFASASEVADLLRYNLEHPQQPRAVSRPVGEERRRRKRTRRRLLALASALLLLSVLMLGTPLWKTYWLSPSAPDSSAVLTAGGAGDSARPQWAGLVGVVFAGWPVVGQRQRRYHLTPLGYRERPGEKRPVRPQHGRPGRGFRSLGPVPPQQQRRRRHPSLGRGDGPGATTSSDAPQQQCTPHRPFSRRPDGGNGQQHAGRRSVGSPARQLRQSLPGDHGTILALAFAPDGHTLATGDARGRIRLWEPATGKERVRFSGDPLGVRALAFAPDSRTLASAGTGDRDVKLWDVTDHRHVRTFSGSVSAPLCLTFSPDGTILAAGTRDGAALLWDVASAQTRATLSAHQGAVWALTFHPNGRLFATGGEDRLVKLWDTVERTAPQP